MYYALCIMHYALCIMHYALCIMHYALCIMHYALCIMHYALCIMHYIYVLYIKNILRLMETISILQYFIVNFHRDIDTGIIRLL